MGLGVRGGEGEGKGEIYQEPVSQRPCALLKLDFPSLAD